MSIPTTQGPTYMGWHDPRKGATPTSLTDGAVRRFERKHGRGPAELVAHPDTTLDPEVASGVMIRTSTDVPLGVVWVGPIDNVARH